jgi:cation:H+ antiporter
MLLNVGILIIGLVLLIFGGDFLVRGASNVAYKAKLSPMVVGLTIVAMGTSAPELVVSLSSVKSNPAISIGNIVGSNICNLALILGITALINPVKILFKDTRVDWFMCLGSGLLLYFFLSGDRVLEAFEGFILVLIVIIYTYYLVEMSRSEAKNNEGEVLEPEVQEELDKALNSKTIVELGFIVLGVALLYFGGEMFVNGAVTIAKDFNVSEEIIGLTIVSIGTSAPELITSVIAAFKKNTDLAYGNLIGSNIFNVLWILGCTSMVHNITISEKMISFDVIVMLLIVLITLPMILIRKQIGRIEGLVLLGCYVSYISYLIIDAIGVGLV